MASALATEEVREVEEATTDTTETMIREMREATGLTLRPLPNKEQRDYMTVLSKMLAESALCGAKNPADAFLLLQAFLREL